MNSFSGFLNNAALMLILCVIYDTFSIHSISNRKVRDGLTGVLVGLIGIAVMLSPWSLQPGVFFDTRWVLLSLCGLFFGIIPTAIAVVIAGAFRLYQGGPGGIVGTVVIVVTACVGLGWKYWKDKHDKLLTWVHLYVFGIVVQLAMLSCMTLMPANLRMPIIKKISLPILLIYPVLTVIIGLILKRQEDRRATDRELAASRKALSRERGLLRGVINSIPDLIFFKSVEGSYLGCNRSFEEFAGREEQSIVGRSDFDLFDTGTAGFFVQKDRLIFESGRPGSNEEWVDYPNGEKILLDTVKTPLREADGTIYGLVGISRNITERKKSEEDRLKLEQQLLHAQKLESLGVLAGGIAHDFNNILTSIVGNADLALMRMNPESPAIDNLHRIEHAAERAADLAQQMLAYSGKGKFVVESLDLARLLDEMLHMLKVSISKKAVLRLNLAAAIPSIEADATQMRQIIMNLVINASEAIGNRSGVIGITTGCMNCDEDYLKNVWQTESLRPGQYVYLEVADNGCGMSGETQAKIFDPFFTTKFTGRGLGMAAVLGIVKGHNGAIKVYSEQGRGTTFKLLLPASGNAEEIFAGNPLVDNWQGAGTVLFVDDEETIRNIGTEMLHELGFEIITSNDGRAAVEIFRQTPDIAFVIMDLTMPHMDGEQCFRELRQLKPDVKVIISSGFSEHEVTQMFSGKGLAGFIQKPYKLSALKEVVRTI